MQKKSACVVVIPMRGNKAHAASLNFGVILYNCVVIRMDFAQGPGSRKPWLRCAPPSGLKGI